MNDALHRHLCCYYLLYNDTTKMYTTHLPDLLQALASEASDTCQGPPQALFVLWVLSRVYFPTEIIQMSYISSIYK